MRHHRIYAYLVMIAFVSGLFGVGGLWNHSSAASTFTLNQTMLIYSRAINTGQSPAKNVVITNTSGGTIQPNISITGTHANQFAFSGGNSPNIGAGNTHTIPVTFNPTSVGVKTAVLNVSFNGETESVELRGLGINNYSGGNNEPSLQRILDTFKYNINVGDDDASTTTIHSSAGGTSGMLGQETPLQRMEKAGGGDVTIEVLAAFGNNVTPVTRVGWYPYGSPSTKNEVFTVNNGSHQTLLPATSGSLSFNPGSTPFGLYSIWPSFGNREVFSEDALNTWHNAAPHKMRFYPLGGNAYIVSTEEYNSGYDYNDVVYIIRNVKPYTPSGSPQVKFENLDWAALMSQGIPNTSWMNSWLTFSRIQGNVVNHKFHDTVTLRIHNIGGGNLNVNQISVTSGFKLVNNETNLSIPGGSFYDLKVQFIASGGSKGQRTGTLNIKSNSQTNNNATFQLSGGWQPVPEEPNEYYTPEIVKIFGFKTNIGIINGGKWWPAGEEVLSKQWKVADPGKSVYVRQIAAFHSCCGAQASFKMLWNNGEKSELLHASHYSQSLLPHSANDPNAGGAEMFVNRSGTFTLDIDARSSCADVCDNAHGIRMWPAKDKDGNTIPNMYIVAQDYTGIAVTNYDYNDNLYIVTNIEPVDPPPADMVLGVSAPPLVTVASNLRLTINARNSSSKVLADDIKLELTLPANTVFTSSTAGSNCAASATAPVVVTCTPGDVNPQQTKSFNINVTPGTIGEQTFVAVLSAKTKDFNLENNTVSVLVDVQPNAKPVAVNDQYVLLQGTTLVIKIVNGVLANDTDANYDPLSVDMPSVTQPTKGTLAMNADGSFTYTPNSPSFSGQDSFTYKVKDAHGVSNNSATVTLKIERPAPVGNPDSYATAEDTALSVNPASGVLANDQASGGASLTAVLVAAPTHASSFDLKPNGRFDYTPALNFNGTDSFTYVAKDGDKASAVTTVEIVVSAVPDAPVANPDSYNVEENDSILVAAAQGVLANDDDGDGQVLSAALHTNVQHGVLALSADGSFAYTPEADYRGVDSFVYTVSDGGSTSTAMVTLNVAQLNQSPLVVADSFIAYRDYPLNVNAAEGLAANDSDADGDTLTFELIGNPGGLDLTLNPNGGFLYNPAPGFVGVVKFTYRASDGKGGSGISLATITVTDDEPPIQLLENGGFEQSAGKWGKVNTTNDLVRCNKAKKTFASEGKCAFQFVGNAGAGSSLTQYPDPANIGSGMSLTFSASVQGKKVKNNAGILTVKVKYADGSPAGKLKMKVPAGTYAYTALSDVLPITGDVDRIVVKLAYNNRGTAGNYLIDDVKLMLSHGAAVPLEVSGVTQTVPNSVIPLPAAPELRGTN